MSLLADQIIEQFDPIQVGIEEFAESSDYCGKNLYPRQRVLLKLWHLEEMDSYEEDVLSEWIKGGKYGDVEISPMIRERRDYLRDNGYKHFREIINVGGRRSSKGFISSFPIAKKIWEVQKLGDPGSHYGIDQDKEIYFSAVAASLDQSKKYQFADIVSTTSRCAALVDHLGKIQEEGFRIHTSSDRTYVDLLKQKGVKIARDWAKLRAVPLAANADTIRGSATMCIVFDEMAFMLPGESRSSADECFKAAEPALAQFGRDGLIMCNSSPYTKVGRFFEEYEKAMEIDGAQPAYPTMMSFKFPSWELYRDWDQDPKRRFRKSIMVSPDWPSEDLNEEERAMQTQEKLEEKANPESYRVERRADWAEVVDAYLNPLVVDRVFAPSFQTQHMPEPRQIKAGSSGTYQYQYAAHLDPSSTTAGFGFALGHLELFPDPEWPDGVSKHVVFDLVKRWNPADYPGHTIDYLKVAAEVLQIIQWFHPYEVTFDQFNSKMPIQWLNQQLQKKNLQHQTRVFEITNTNKDNWHKWENMKTGMNLDLVHIPNDCPDSDYSELELKFLQKKESGQVPKVEKQTVGPVQTKDIADCIREVCFKLTGSHWANFAGGALADVQIAGGAPGGYQIGGREQGGPRAFEDFYGGKRGGGGDMRTRGIGGGRRGR